MKANGVTTIITHITKESDLPQGPPGSPTAPGTQEQCSFLVLPVVTVVDLAGHLVQLPLPTVSL